MTRSSLFGRRIHISGSICTDEKIASTVEVKKARGLIKGLVCELIKRGSNFVVPIDAEKRRLGDEQPICFDWLVLRELEANLAYRPSDTPNPFIVAVQHHKSERQIPKESESLWDKLRCSNLVQIENVSHWNMGSKRLEAQARWGDILIALGGSDGVLFLADLYFNAGKPVVPLNPKIAPTDTGALRLFRRNLSYVATPDFLKVTKGSPHGWINRINFTDRHSVSDRIRATIELLEALERPEAFVIRLLDPDHESFLDVENFFSQVVQPVIEGEYGYRMTTIDRSHPHDHARIDQEIFVKLHRSSFVLADITGMRPNCLIELGYALGRGLPVMLTAKNGEVYPFDICTLAGLRWTPTGTVKPRQQSFREHWASIRHRPPLVPVESLAT